MKFTCTKENFSHALDIVSGLACKHINLPILANILIQTEESVVRLTTTNLEIVVKANLRAKVENVGSFTVPAKTLSDFIHLLGDEQVVVELQDSELSIKCASSATKIKGSPADEYPIVPEIEEKHAYALSVDEFKRALSQTVFAAAKNEIRPELSGVYFGLFTERYAGLLLAATDSYRLAERTVSVAQGNDEMKCIVPSRSLYEVIRLLGLSRGEGAENNVRLWLSENQIALRYDDFEMTSRLVDGKYPDYAQIIPDKFKTSAVFSAIAMINKIKAASLFTTIGVNAVVFDLNKDQNTISVSSTSTQTGEHSSEIDAEIIGEENSTLLNHRYVLDGLQSMDAEEIEFKVNNGDSPCMFRPKGKEGYVYIVMPIRQ